jgi:predicted kinase
MSKTKKVKLMIGLPASGKTTWCEDFLRKNHGWVRISRDDFRFMLRNQPMLDFKGESLVTKLCFNSAKLSLIAGYNVLIDNTHLREAYIEDAIRELGEMADLDYHYIDTPAEVCVARDRERERSVGESVIMRMKKDLEILLENFSFEPYQKTSRARIDYSTDWEPSLPDAVIFDLDGTLAHMQNRRGPFEWKKVGLDMVDQPMVRAVKAWKNSGVEIIVASGRDASCKSETVEWLKSAGVEFDRIFMRPQGDFRKDSLIKEEIYVEQIKGKFNVIMIYDDRDQVVELWRSLGLKCAQVEYGNF